MTQLLICTDLDRTLLPNGDLNESPLARERFAAVASHPNVTLVYVSGRDLGLVEQAIKHFSIPIPDWVIGDVGSSLYSFNDLAERSGQGDVMNPIGWIHSSAWQEKIAFDWPGLGSSQIAQALSSLDGLVIQEPARQSRYKLSYYLPLGFDLIALRLEIEARLKDAGVPASGVNPPAPPPRLSRGGPRTSGGWPNGWRCKGWAGPFPWFEYHLNQTNHAHVTLCRT